MFRLRTLGGASLEENGTTLDTVGAQRKTLALLALLAVSRGHGVSRERLGAYLWPESDTERARGALKQALHVLRRQLGSPDAVLGSSELRLNPAYIESDVGAFLTALDDEKLDVAAGLYGGPFLDGFHLSGAPEFEQWASGQRDTLERAYASALERLAASAEARGDPEAAIGWLRRLQVLDPLSARVTLRLMRALDAAGERSAALRCAQVHDALLREELDSPPDPEIAALVVALRSELSRPAAARAISAHDQPGDERVSLQDRGPAVRELAAAERETAVRRGGWARVLAAAAAVLLIGAVLLFVGRQTGAVAGTAGAGVGRSVAILPFTNPAGDSTIDHLSSGLTDELAGALDRHGDLRVAPRSTASALARRGLAAREIGESLGVAAVVEGVVRRAGEGLTVETRLTGARDGAVLWTRTLGGAPHEVATAQEEIAHGIAAALDPGAADRRAPRTARRQPDPDAYELYLRGRHAWRQRTRDALQQAVVFLEGSIEHDPGFAAAHAALAGAYVNLSNFGYRNPAEALARAELAADRAIALDAASADAHAVKGFVLASRLEFGAAEAALNRAIALNPSHTWAHHYYTLLLLMLGRTDEALDHNREALASDPLSLPANTTRGIILGQRGDLAGAERELERALAIAPDFPLTQYYLAVVHAARGHDGRAGELLEQADRQAPGFTGVPGARALLLHRRGRPREADSLVAALEAHARTGDHRARVNLAFAHAVLGRADDAFRLFDGARWDVPSLIELRADPLLAPMRSDPRYAALLRRIGADR